MGRGGSVGQPVPPIPNFLGIGRVSRGRIIKELKEREKENV